MILGSRFCRYNGRQPFAGPVACVEVAMDEDELRRLISVARVELQEKNNAYIRDYALRLDMPYHWLLDRPELMWYEGDQPKVVARVQMVGSISDSDGTWLWGWGNPSVPDSSTADLARVREFGVKESILQLVTSEWAATDRDGEDMTALSAYILDAKGFFRHRSQDLTIFFVITDIAWADEKTW
jgi:hypothetical protein